MNMREKIVRAIWMELQRNSKTPEWVKKTPYGIFGQCVIDAPQINAIHEDLLHLVDAVLEAIREPTGGMIEAGYGEHNNGSPRDRYTAMIDAARRGSDDQ